MEKLHYHYQQKRDRLIHHKVEDKKSKLMGGGSGGGKNRGSRAQRGYIFPIPSSVTYRTVKGGVYGAKRDYGSHKGVDLAVPEGTQILAPEDGQIVKKGNSKLGGLYVWFKTKDGTVHKFMHLRELPNAALGATFKAGNEIARSGNTGRSSGPHVHWEVLPGKNTFGLPTTKGKQGTYIPPMQWAGKVGAIPMANASAPAYTTNLKDYQAKVGQNSVVWINQAKTLIKGQGFDSVSDETAAYYLMQTGNDPVKAAQLFASHMGGSPRDGTSKTAASQRHDFESGITEVFRDMLGIAPDKSTLAMFMSRYDADGGISYNINDVREYVRNSEDYKTRLKEEFTPSILALYKEHTGIEDASGTPGFAFVMDKLKVGEWNINQAQNFIANSRQARAYGTKVRRSELFENLAARLGLNNIGDLDRSIMPKVEAGYVMDEIEGIVRRSDSFAKRYPGIGEHEDVADYDRKVTSINSMLQKYEGRSLDYGNAQDIEMIKTVKA